MAIRLQDDEPMNYQEQFGDSQVVLVPIHENRIGEEGYEQMLREARLFADTYDKILVGVLEAYCTYSSHPILGNIPVLPAGQAGSGTVPRPLTLFESPEEGWRAVAQGLAELLEPYRPFFQPGIRGRVFFDTEKNAWRFDKGRKDGVSIWHREVSLDTENGPLDIGIEEVFSDYAILRRTAGMEEGPDKVFNATVNTEPRWEIDILIQDHAGNSSLVRELQNSQALQQFGWRFTNEIPRLDYVLHLTQTHAYLTRAFENPNDEDEELYLNPYRPLTKPIPLTSGKETIEKFLKQAANREYLRRLEAPYSEQLGEEALEIKVFHSQGTDWEELSPEDGVVSVPLWAKPLKGGVSYQNTIRIQAANRSERTLYVSAFLLSAYFGSDGGLIEGGQIELKPGEAVQLFERGDGRIPVELNGRTLAYNLPSEPWEVKFLASPRPLSTDGYWMGNLPGPPGSFFLEEEGYFMEKAREMERIEPPEGQWVAPLLKLRLQNPAYNRPRYDMLTNLLRRPDAEVFLRALYFESHALAPRYWLKAGIELQGGDTESQVDPDTIPFEAYTYAPDGLAILEYQLEQLAPQLSGRSEKGIVVALGDSWYNQAQPVDITEELKGNYLVVKAPLEDWGQLEEAVRRVEKYMANLPSSVTLLLSADGARIFDHPAAFLRESPPERDENIGLILRDQFSLVLGDLRESWLNGLKYLAGFGGRLQVIVHGYDYFPTEAYGSRLGDFPPEWRRNVISFLVDSLNARLEAAIRDMGSENIHYLDFRNTLESNEWRSGVLPGPSGFGKLAGQIGLFISRRYSLGEEPFPGTAYFLWQAARISDTKEDYQVLIDAYPEGEHRPWAEERLREVRSGKSEAGSRGAGWEALQALRRRANDLISSNQLGELFELLDRELRRDAEPRERLAVYRKEFEQMEKQRRRYKRPSRQLERDMASLADAVGELVEGLAEEELGEIGSRKSEMGSEEPSAKQPESAPESPAHPLTPSPKAATFTDPRDGRTYRTVELNGLVWMAENLNYDVGEGCWFYDNDPKNGEKYGRLYDWEAAQRACPPGWRLPTDEEWQALEEQFGGEEGAYEALMEGGGSGFEAVHGGCRNSKGYFSGLGASGYYWTGTEQSTRLVWRYRFQGIYGNLNRYSNSKSYAFSCRYVQEVGGLEETLPEAGAEVPEAAEEPAFTSQTAEFPNTETPNTEHRITAPFTDPRDNRTYRTIELNGLRWMAENFSYDAGEGSWFFENNPETGAEYGRFYGWETAQEAAPAGWRLPTDEEWAALRDALGGPRKAFAALLETGAGNFNARLVNGFANYWSATERGPEDAWCYSLSRKNGELRRTEMKKGSGLSCRYVQEIGDLEETLPEAETEAPQGPPAEQAEAPEEESPDMPELRRRLAWWIGEDELEDVISYLRSTVRSSEIIEEVILGESVLRAARQDYNRGALNQEGYFTERARRAYQLLKLILEIRPQDLEEGAAFPQLSQPAPVQVENYPSMKEFLDAARSLLRQGQLEQFLQLLENAVSPSSPAWVEVYLQKSRLARIRRAQVQGVITQEGYDAELSRIANAGIEFIQDLEESDLRMGVLPEKTTSQESTAGQAEAPESPSHPLTPSPKTGAFTDPRDGRTYRSVELGGLVWMAENLNYDVGEGCWFYDDDPKNGEKYGRLYTWEAAQKACPPGWRLPTDGEWFALREKYGDIEGAYRALIEGENSGFFALLGGYRDADGSFRNLGDYGDYWSATKSGGSNAWYYYFDRSLVRLNRHFNNKDFGFSCRCVQAIGNSSI